MKYSKIFIFIFLFIFSCNEKKINLNYNKDFKNYKNKGFALIYDDNLYRNNIISNKINNSSLLILNMSLKQETQVKVTNLLNGKYLIAKVGKKSTYPIFYNSVISKRISDKLQIDCSVTDKVSITLSIMEIS